jgi:hypothetical protein
MGTLQNVLILRDMVQMVIIVFEMVNIVACRPVAEQRPRPQEDIIIIIIIIMGGSVIYVVRALCT